MGKYNAADVAAFIITEVNNSQKSIGNLQLQKILFFCQCEYLQKFGEPLFSDQMVAWQYGPVVRSVYNAYSYRGASPIERPAKYVESTILTSRTPIKPVDGETAAVIRDVIAKWIDRPKWDLVMRSHIKGGAWDTIYNANGIEKSGYNEVIPVELMRNEALV